MTLSVVKTVSCCIIRWLISWLTLCHFYHRIVFVEEYNLLCSHSHYGVGNLDTSYSIYCSFRLLQGAQSWYPLCLYCCICLILLSSVILCQQFIQFCVCVTLFSICISWGWCTYPKGQVPRVIKYCTVVLNICWCSVWNLIQIPVLAPWILRTLLDFWKICVSLCKFTMFVTNIMKF